jgi:hypothetical protein
MDQRRTVKKGAKSRQTRIKSMTSIAPKTIFCIDLGGGCKGSGLFIAPPKKPFQETFDPRRGRRQYIPISGNNEQIFSMLPRLLSNGAYRLLKMPLI